MPRVERKTPPASLAATGGVAEQRANISITQFTLVAAGAQVLAVALLLAWLGGAWLIVGGAV